MIIFRWFLPAFFGVVLIVAGVYYIRNSRQTPYWQDLQIASVHLDGIDSAFSVKGGKIYKNGKAINSWMNRGEYDRVLKLALFYQWAKEDPLMFGSSMPTEPVLASLEKLKVTDAELAKSIRASFDPLKNESLKLHPLDFLDTFLETSKQYQTLATDVSEKQASQLLDDMKKTDEAYAKDAQKFEDDFISANGNDNQYQFVYMPDGTVSTVEIIKNDLEKIKKNQELATGEIQKREDCLKKGAAYCQRPAENILQPAALKMENKENTKLLTPRQAGISEDEKSTGPYQVNSSCWGGRSQSYIYYGQRCGLSVGCAEYPFLADDAYFTKPADTNPTGKALLDRGVALTELSTTTPYGCNNLDYMPTLNTLDYFYNTTKDDRIFEKKIQTSDLTKNGKIRDVIEGGVQAEKAFYEARYPSQDALDRLEQYYAFAYGQAVKNNWFSADVREQLLARHLLISERFVQLDLAINRNVYHLSNYANEVSKTNVSLPIRYLYASRSNYSLFFLSFSSSVWLNTEKPAYLRNDADRKTLIDGNGKQILNYAEASQQYAPEQLYAWQQIFRNIKKEENAAAL